MHTPSHGLKSKKVTKTNKKNKRPVSRPQLKRASSTKNKHNKRTVDKRQQHYQHDNEQLWGAYAPVRALPSLPPSTPVGLLSTGTSPSGRLSTTAASNNQGSFFSPTRYNTNSRQNQTNMFTPTSAFINTPKGSSPAVAMNRNSPRFFAASPFSNTVKVGHDHHHHHHHNNHSLMAALFESKPVAVMNSSHHHADVATPQSAMSHYNHQQLLSPTLSESSVSSMRHLSTQYHPTSAAMSGNGLTSAVAIARYNDQLETQSRRRIGTNHHFNTRVAQTVPTPTANGKSSERHQAATDRHNPTTTASPGMIPPPIETGPVSVNFENTMSGKSTVPLSKTEAQTQKDTQDQQFFEKSEVCLDGMCIPSVPSSKSVD